MSEGRGPRIPHVAALDGARGVAVAGVVLFHAGHLKGGYLGVDFFFVLSGYLITSLLLAEAATTGSVGLGGFWSRRARRLLPALALLLVGVVAYCVVFAHADELAQIRGDAFATIGYVANWRQVFSHQNYFALFRSPSPLNHTWSLAIEEQFYLLWPLVFVALLWRFRSRTPRAVLVTALAGAAVSSALMFELYSPGSTTRAYYGTDTRAAAILFGVALAAWVRWRGTARARVARIAIEVVGGVGVGVLALAWVALDGQSRTLYRGGFLACGLAATAVIAAATHPQRGPIARALEWKPLVGLGLISYGVYLYHWPIDIVVDRDRMGFGGWPLVLVQVAATLAVSIASFRLVERPIRRGAIPALRWRTLTPAIACGLAVGIVAATAGSATSVFVPQAGPHPVAAARDAYDRAPLGATRILLVGNSVAFTLGTGFAQLSHADRLAVFDAAVPACAFPPQLSGRTIRTQNGFERARPCGGSWERAVVKAYRPDLVFWMVANPGGLGARYHGRPVLPCSTTYNRLYADALRSEIARLRSSGAHVVVVTAATTMTFALVDTRQTACDNAVRRQVARATGTTVADLAEFVCPNEKCRAFDHGVRLRPDGLHYEGPSAVIVARWLLAHSR